ncbi:MAG TPA: methyltransferase domain-containing protein [Longimicrobiales bacterium]
MNGSRVTRGKGRLEGFLARHRARMANRLIPEELRGGRIVDIGCGSYPYFLSTTRFAHRFGLDRLASVGAPAAEGPTPSGAAGSAPGVAPGVQGPEGVTLIHHDLAGRTALPFDDGSVDVVTMLAVFEHLDHDVLRHTLAEIRRILRPGGVYVLTTPAAWTDRLLRALARLGLVSAEEIEEHKDAYTHARIADLLAHAGFDRAAMRFGTFEFGMNLWATVRR